MKIDAKLMGTRNIIVEIKAKDGKQHSKPVEFAQGDPRKPISKGNLLAKFRHCVRYSLKPPSWEKTEDVIEMVECLKYYRRSISIS